MVQMASGNTRESCHLPVFQPRIQNWHYLQKQSNLIFHWVPRVCIVHLSVAFFPEEISSLFNQVYFTYASLSAYFNEDYGAVIYQVVHKEHKILFL